MKKLLLLSAVMALFACSNQGRVDNSETTPSLDTSALVQRVNDIYDATFKRYNMVDSAADTHEMPTAGADSLFCSQDWNDWTHKVRSADEALAADGMMGFFEADYWIMGQDWQDLSVSDVRVVSMTDSTAVTELNLHNCGNVTAVRLEMVNDNNEWKIDNFIDVTNNVDWKANMKEYMNNQESNQR